MATVRCPECGRALNFPDGQDALVARCPLCAREFVAFERQIPPPPGPRLVPVPVPLPALPGLDAADAQALDQAAGWLGWAGIVIPLYGCSGGCFTCAGIARLFQTGSDDREVMFLLLLGWLVTQGVASSLLLITAYNVRHPGYGWWVICSTRTLRLLALAYLAGAAGLHFVPHQADHGPFDVFRWALIAASVVACGVCLFTAHRAARLLGRPTLAARLAPRE